jgi:hypothetical protein
MTTSTKKLAPLFAIALSACQPAKAPVHDTFTKVNRASVNIASLNYGDTTTPTKTGDDYGWAQFSGNIGDSIDVLVHSTDGCDAVAFLLDANNAIVAMSDDGDATTTDAHIVATLPSDGTYYIAYRDFAFTGGTFTVTLKGDGVFTCHRDAECTAVKKAGCCDNGTLAAVRADRIDDYDTLYACSDSAPICSHVYVQDTRVAQCSNASHKCEMVNPADIRCGGFVANPHQCASGWQCQISPPAPDVSGHCVQ